MLADAEASLEVAAFESDFEMVGGRPRDIGVLGGAPYHRPLFMIHIKFELLITMTLTRYIWG